MKRFIQITLLLVLLVSVSLLVTAGTAQLIAKIPVAGNHTEGIAFSADGKYAYSVGYLRNDAAQFHVIDMVKHKAVKGSPVTYARLRDNYDLCVTTHASGAGRRAYVPNFLDNSVDVLNLDPTSPDYILTNKKPIDTIPVGTRPTDCALNFPEDSRLYVTNSRDNTVSVINTKTNEVIGDPITLEKGYDSRAIAASGKEVAYTVSFRSDPNSAMGLVNAIDLQKNKVVAVIENVGRLPNDVAIEPDGLWAVVPNKNGHDVTFIDTATHKVKKRVPLPDESIPVYVTVSLNKYVYVANTGYDNSCQSGSVYVIDSRTYRIVGTICVGDPDHGGAAGELAVSPNNRYLYVADYLARGIYAYDLCPFFYPEGECQ